MDDDDSDYGAKKKKPAKKKPAPKPKAAAAPPVAVPVPIAPPAVPKRKLAAIVDVDKPAKEPKVIRQHPHSNNVATAR